MLRHRLRKWRLPLLFLIAAVALLTSCGGGVPSACWFGLAADDDTAYLAASQQVVALNLQSGAELWAFPAEADKETGPFYATPLLRGDAINVGAYDAAGRLYAISQDLGLEEWAVETGAPIVDGVTFADGRLVLGNNNGEVFLIVPETQEKLLLFKVDRPIWATPRIDEASGRVYIASMDHHVYAVDLERRERLWDFEAGGALVGTPAIGHGTVFVGTLTSTFYAIDAETGDELWRFKTDGWVWGGPLVDGDTVYFGDLVGNLYALDVSDGSERWTFTAEGGVRATPTLWRDLLYFGTREGEVYALKAEDGTQQWMMPMPGAIYTQPVVAGDHLLVSPHNAKVRLVALDPESGAERWSYPPQEE
jgi:outer membrane protein assembly factor BamB